MGVEGEDFIDNPNRIEYVYDDDEVGFVDHIDVLVNYMDDEDYEDEESDGDVLLQMEDDGAFEEDDEDDYDYYPSHADYMLSDSEEESDEELRGTMVNGVFVQSVRTRRQVQTVEAAAAVAAVVAKVVDTVEDASQAEGDSTPSTSNGMEKENKD